MNIHKYYVIVSVGITLLLNCTPVDPVKNYQPLLDQYLRYWNSGQFKNIEAVLHPEFELRMTPVYEPEKGIDRFKEGVLFWRKAYPDFKVLVDEFIWSENAVTIRWTITASNTGEGMHPPTGKSVKVPGMSIIHFRDGKISDEWIASNNGYWMKQLGFTLIPPAEIQIQ